MDAPLSRHKRLRRSSILNHRPGLQSHNGWDTNDLRSLGFESADRALFAEGKIEVAAYFQILRSGVCGILSVGGMVSITNHVAPLQGSTGIYSPRYSRPRQYRHQVQFGLIVNGSCRRWSVTYSVSSSNMYQARVLVIPVDDTNDSQVCTLFRSDCPDYARPHIPVLTHEIELFLSCCPVTCRNLLSGS